MTDQLINFRRAFDERLTALEAGLADPDNCPSLEVLVLDLARASGDEAAATARDAVLHAQREANATTGVAIADAAQAHVLLDTERTTSATLRTEIATLKGHLSTAITARRDADVARQREIAGLTATIAQFQQARDEARIAATNSADGLAAATVRADEAAHDRDALVAKRDALLAERDALVVERDAAIAKRDALAAGRDALVAERDALSAERDGLLNERAKLNSEHAAFVTAAKSQASGLKSAAEHADAATRDRDALIAERDSLLVERARLNKERTDFVRAHDAMALQRDTLVHEREDIVRERDKEIVRLREELTAARASARETAASSAESKQTASPALALVPPPPQSLPMKGPARQADRQAFSSALGVQIDGEAALLVDLSLTGAQVLSCSSLKPARTVKMLLPSSESPVLCRGRIIWARLEPTSPGKPIRYRAGMFFTTTDQAAVQTFISRHGARS